MKSLLKIISISGLALTLAPSFFVFNGAITAELSKTLMLSGTVIWFISASFWMNKADKKEEVEN